MFLDGVNEEAGGLELLKANRESLSLIVEQLRAEISADMAMVSYLTATDHHVVVSAGFILSPALAERVPLENSICCHATAMDFPLVVDDANTHPLLWGNLTVRKFGVAAYLGAPIHVPKGDAVGTICAMQRKARRWREVEIGQVIDKAQEIDRLIDQWGRRT